MITPSQCKSLWKQFKAETEFTITQAVSTQVCISYNIALISDISLALRVKAVPTSLFKKILLHLLFFHPSKLTGAVIVNCLLLGQSWPLLFLVSMRSWCLLGTSVLGSTMLCSSLRSA
jgi:hypothetical protein